MFSIGQCSIGPNNFPLTIMLALFVLFVCVLGFFFVVFFCVFFCCCFFVFVVFVVFFLYNYIIYKTDLSRVTIHPGSVPVLSLPQMKIIREIITGVFFYYC